MGFFNELPRGERTLRTQLPRPPWVSPPADELPAALAAPVILVRTAHTVVALTQVLVYSVGVEFTLTGRIRMAEVPDRWPLSMFGGAAPGGPLPDDVLRFGFQLADGFKLTNLDSQVGRHDPATEPQHPVLRPVKANTDSPGRYDFRQWMWPLPPPGKLTVVCEWPSRDIPETRVKLDADLILDAAKQVVSLW